MKTISHKTLSLLLATLEDMLKYCGSSASSSNLQSITNAYAVKPENAIQTNLQSQIHEQVDMYNFNDLSKFYQLAVFTAQTVSAMNHALVSISSHHQYANQVSIPTITESIRYAAQTLTHVSARFNLIFSRHGPKSHISRNDHFVLSQIFFLLPISYYSITRLVELECLP